MNTSIATAASIRITSPSGYRLFRIWMILTFVYLAPAGVLGPGIQPSVATAGGLGGISPADACVDAQPDDLIYAPADYVGGIYVSHSGFYGYRPCPYFLVDILMGTYSACGTPPADCFNLEWSSGSYDLPSSGPANAYKTLPQNADDCGRYRVWRRLYTKPHTDSFFTLVYEESGKGRWNSLSGTAKRS